MWFRLFLDTSPHDLGWGHGERPLMPYVGHDGA
jgi:hypothetical protein